jgi:superfamily II DNA or RNA helicase
MPGDNRSITTSRIMNFSSLSIKKHYHSDSDNLLTDFYRPILGVARKYDRAVGYFSSSTFKSCASELRHLISKDGKVRLIIGCLTNSDDIDELANSPNTTLDVEREHLRVKILQYLDALEGDDPHSARTFATLISAGVVELRFALRPKGIYHEKFGVFEDSHGRQIAFIGSANETEAALNSEINHESISVFDSFDSYIFESYGAPLVIRFEELWQGKGKNTKIYTLDSDVLNRIRHLATEPKNQSSRTETTTLTSDLRPYQKEALIQWSKNQYRGILAMATGTGKTRTAIQAIKRFREERAAGVIVITVPYQNLALQWIQELETHSIPSFPVFQSYDAWFDAVKSHVLFGRFAGDVKTPCLVCVNKTFNEPRFRELLGLLSENDETKHFLVADEVHHFNSDKVCSALPTIFSFRLGLSATPYDQFEGNDEARFLEKYFGPIVFEFPIKRAIQENFLCSYNFEFFSCELTDDESLQYEEITKKIARILSAQDASHSTLFTQAQPLLLARSRIVATAVQKIDVLRTYLKNTGRQPLSLFYCGDGSVETESGTRRQVEVISKLLNELGWRSSRVTADESLRSREAILESFENGDVDALVSIRVLDEGIDVPATRRAYLLASQSSNRQGIQRRGRVLRRHQSKLRADIFDFVVIGGALSATSARGLARRELKRAIEFADAAANREEQLAKIKTVCQEVALDFEEIFNDT